MKPYTIEDDFGRVLVDGLALYAYVVSPATGDEEERGALVYAQCERTACELGAFDMDGDADSCEARRAPEHDARALLFLAGRAEDDPEYLRDAGWHYEGEWRCGCCGLAAFGIEAYGVCRQSSQCKVCKCDDDPELGPCDHEDGFSCA